MSDGFYHCSCHHLHIWQFLSLASLFQSLFVPTLALPGRRKKRQVFSTSSRKNYQRLAMEHSGNRKTKDYTLYYLYYISEQSMLEITTWSGANAVVAVLVTFILQENTLNRRGSWRKLQSCKASDLRMRGERKSVSPMANRLYIPCRKEVQGCGRSLADSSG